MDIKRWLILFSMICFIFGIYQAAHASEIFDTSIVVLNSATLQKGFTVKSADKNLWIPVLPKEYQKDLTVKISRVNNIDALPSGLAAVSPYYNFQITSSAIQKYKPVTLSFAFNSGNNNEKAVYYFDGGASSWRELESKKIDWEKKIIRAEIPFQSAEVAVLEKAGDGLTAQSAIVYKPSTGDILFQKNTDEKRPIASLTKLAAALVFLENNPGWDKKIEMKRSDFVGGASIWVKQGDVLTVKDLFYSAMVGSKNNAVEALVRSTGLTKKEFVDKMNLKAKELGLTKTYFVEPTGLSEDNYSTAYEMAEIAKEAFGKAEILKATTTKVYKVKPANSKAVYTIKNTSEKLFNRGLTITGSKTGWTDEAGYNLVTQAKDMGEELIAIVLGAKIRENYEEVFKLLKEYL